MTPAQDGRGHTAGPWVVEWNDDDDSMQKRYDILGPPMLRSSGRSTVASVSPWTLAPKYGNPEMPEEARANARLIASAPALLDALRRVTTALQRVLDAPENPHDEPMSVEDFNEMGACWDDVKPSIDEANTLLSTLTPQAETR